jgi:hypothetical protein
MFTPARDFLLETPWRIMLQMCCKCADITVSQQCCNSAASKWSSGAQGENSSQLSAEMEHIQSTNAALAPWEQVLQFGKGCHTPSSPSG